MFSTRGMGLGGGYVPSSGSRGEAGTSRQKLDFIIGAVNMATPGIAAVAAGFANLTSVGMRASTALTENLSMASSGLLAAGMAAALALGYATVQAAQFEQKMKMVQAVSGSTNQQLSQMSDDIKNLAMKYGMGATEIASSMSIIGRAGLADATAQTKIFENALKMAKIEGMEVSTAIEGIVTQTNLWGGSVDRPEEFTRIAQDITKTLTHASQISPTDVQQLLMGAKYAGGSAQLAQWNYQELYGTLAYMASKGIQGEVAGTALRGFLTKTSAEQPQFVEALGKLGLSVADLWPGEGNAALKPVEMFSLIMGKMNEKGLSNQEKMGIWTQLAQQKTSQQILKIKPEELQDYLNKMKEQFDLDQKVAVAMDSAMEQFNRLKSTIEVGLINIGESFLPMLKPIIEGLQGLLQILANNKAMMTIIAGILISLVGGAIFIGLRFLAAAFGFLYKELINVEGGLVGVFRKFAEAETQALGFGAAQDKMAGSIGRANSELAYQKILLEQNAIAAGTTGVAPLGTIASNKMTQTQARGAYNSAMMTDMLGMSLMAGGIGADGFRGLFQGKANRPVTGRYFADTIENIYGIRGNGRTSSGVLGLASQLMDRAAGEMDSLSILNDTIIMQQGRVNEYGIARTKGEKKELAKLKSAVSSSRGAQSRLKNKLSTKMDILSMLERITDVGIGAADIDDLYKSRGISRPAARVGILSRGKTAVTDFLGGMKTQLLGVTEAQKGAAVGAEALGMSFASIGIYLLPLIVLFGVLYILIKNHQKEVKRLEEVHVKATEKLAEEEQQINNLYNAYLNSPDDITIKVKFEAEIKDLEEKAQDAWNTEYEAKKKKYSDTFSIETGIFGNASTFNKKASELPIVTGNAAIHGQYSNNQVTAGLKKKGVNTDELQTMYGQMVEHYEDLKKISDAKALYGEDSPQAKKASVPLIKEGYTEKQIQSMVEAQRLEWRIQSLNKRFWDSIFKVLYSIGHLVTAIFGPILGFTKATNKSTDAQKDATKEKNKDTNASDRQSLAFQLLAESLWWVAQKTAESIAWWETLANTITWVGDVIGTVISNLQAMIAGITDPVGGAEAFKKKVDENLAKGMNPYQAMADAAGAQADLLKNIPAAPAAVTADQVMGGAANPDWQSDLSDLEGAGADAAGAGGDGTGGTGDGSGSGDSKGGKIRAGYEIDFVLCSKKTLPPLDPNLFKRKPPIELTQKTFKIDKMHINTRDKPEAIQAGVKKAIIDVGTSDTL